MKGLIIFQVGIFMLVCVMYWPTYVESACTVLPYPEKYLNCCLGLESDYDKYKLTGEEINGFCLQTYLVNTPEERWDYDFDVTSGYKYIGKLLSDGFQDMLTKYNITHVDDNDTEGYYNRGNYQEDDYDDDSYYHDDEYGHLLKRKKRQSLWNRSGSFSSGGSTNRDTGRNNVDSRLQALKNRVNTRYSGCTRREIRSLSAGELQRFHSVIRQARQDTRLRPNVWEFYAQWHSGVRIRAVHGGPAFLPWHRVLLLSLERALQVYDSSFCLPYWDPVIEFHMNNPRNSILFTEEYIGSANGYLTGRYSGLGISRNVRSQKGMLISPEKLRLVYAQRNPQNVVFDASRVRSEQPASVIEILHNDVHQFVGGIMDDLSRAAADPLFWLHHCNIDRIWENYRIRNGIAYPFGTGDHAAGEIMKQFGEIVSLSWLNGGRNITNADGVSAAWRNMVRYSSPPTSCRGGPCERQTTEGGGNSGRTGGSNWRGTGTRQSGGSTGWSRGSTSGQTSRRTSGWNSGQTSGRTSGWNSGRTSSGWSRGMTRGRENRVSSGRPSRTGWGTRTTSSSGIWGRKKRSVSSYRDFKTDYSDPAIQHSFYINGRCDADQWVYVPVPVIFTRPEGLHFNSYTIKDGKIKYGHDIFDTYLYSSLKRCIKMGHQKPFKTCKVAGSGQIKIFVETVGKNYCGKMKEYALVDERFPISKSMAYVAIRKPSYRPTEVFFNAFDECGRTCKPMCLVEGSSPPIYRRCSGVLKIDNKEPRMYGDTIADAVLKHWDFPRPSTHISPNTNSAAYCIMFLCDSSSNYPWDKEDYQDY